MIRVLVLIAVTGFFVCLVTLSTAVALGGPAIFERVAWNGWSRDWDWVDSDRGWGYYGHHGRLERHRSGPDTTRTLDWNGGDSLTVDVPADVEYTQAPGPAKLTVSGSPQMVDDVEVDGDRITWRHRHHHMHWGDLTIVMSAPSVKRFELEGSGKLTIAGYKQDKLGVDVSGSSDVTVSGETGAVDLEVSGSGDADLSALKAKSADVRINGSGNARLAPTDEAKVDISGSGDVTLLTRPGKLDTQVSGSGSLHQEDHGTSAAPAPPAPPAAPAAPKAPKAPAAPHAKKT